jgi:hypothetical protein
LGCFFLCIILVFHRHSAFVVVVVVLDFVAEKKGLRSLFVENVNEE